MHFSTRVLGMRQVPVEEIGIIGTVVNFRKRKEVKEVRSAKRKLLRE